jgi:methionyl-tRNA synthetase
MAKHLVTSALPYANGPLHFGHIAGVYLPADIYTRHKRLQGHEVLHISGSDEHGVAIMQNAQKKKKPYKKYVDGWHKRHKDLFDKYDIHFSYFGQTSEPYHAEETLKWFHTLHDKGYIEKEDEKQLQCQNCSNYLPDRYVEGTCYVCGYEKARGDECPNCGTWIDPLKLKNPVCQFCQSTDIQAVDVFQWYLKMSKYHSEFRKWFESKRSGWKKTVSSFIDSLSKDELVDRAITRDLDWGIDVPLEEAKGKKLYVWFDAPIGYVSNTKELLKDTDQDYLKDWWQNKDVTLTHFIGKDNIIFHGIIFPVMSMASGHAKAVDDLPANQYLNLMGKQFSKSQGWYVDAEEAIHEFGSDNLRYYLTTLIPENNDSSFTWEGYEARVNNELANNIGNFVNRSMSFFKKNWPEGIEESKFHAFFETDRSDNIKKTIEEFHEAIDNYQIKKGLELLMGLGNEANLYFSDEAPWAQFKEDVDKAADTIAFSAVYTAILAVLFEPYLPNLSQKARDYFTGLEEIKSEIYNGEIESLKKIFSGNVVLAKKPKGLVKKVEAERIKELTAQFS